MRWAQQRARLAGYTTSPSAGVWRLSRDGEQALGNQRRGTVVTVAVTSFGVFLWAEVEDLVTRCLGGNRSIARLQQDAARRVFHGYVRPDATPFELPAGGAGRG